MSVIAAIERTTVAALEPYGGLVARASRLLLGDCTIGARFNLLRGPSAHVAPQEGIPSGCALWEGSDKTPRLIAALTASPSDLARDLLDLRAAA